MAEQWLDESVPGWREDIDRQAIQSGSDDEDDDDDDDDEDGEGDFSMTGVDR